ncbi:MAG: CHASE domain-containing protein [Legionellales bacterium]|nr:CHASE domain-containing protein [Legionellales bacterium]
MPKQNTTETMLLTAKIKWPTVTLFFCGTLVCLLGFAGLVSWYILFFNQPDSTFNFLALYDGTSLGFIISGLAILSSAWQQWRISNLLALILLTLNILALFRYFLSLSPHINMLFALITTGALHEAILGPVTTLPFIFTAFGLLYLPLISKRQENSIFLGILGALIIALGLIKFLGSNNNILTFYGWAHIQFTEIATTIGFIILGVATISCAWHRALIGESPIIRYLPMMIVSVVIFLTLLLWQALISQRGSNIQRMIKIQSEGVHNEIIARMQARVHALERMGQRWEIRSYIPKSEWQADARSVMADYPGFHAIEWVDSNFVVRWIVPEKENQKIIGLNATFEKERGNALLNARTRQKIMMTRLVDLLQGGKGFIIYVPIYRNQQFDGFMLSVIKPQPLFDDLLPPTIASGYNLAVFEGQQKLYQRGDSDQKLQRRWSQWVNLQLYGVEWRIEIWPTPNLLELESSVLPSITLIMGLMMALLLGLAIRFAQLAQSRARQLELLYGDLKREIKIREQAEEAKQAMEAVLLQSQKLQAVGTLAGGIAHDFNNILYSILGYVGLAREDVPKDSMTFRNLGKVLEVGKRGQKLVDQILSFSRRQSYEFSVISLNTVLEDVMTLIKPTLPATISLHMEIDPKPHYIFGNSNQLEQVFVNIINNAVDAMNRSGAISIRLTLVQANEYFLSAHPDLDATQYYLLEFKDDGCGMDLPTQQRIFEPFFTTKEVHKGTGLGMALAHGIIRDHKGDIIVESEVGAGTTFYLYLPCYEKNGDHQDGIDSIS